MNSGLLATKAHRPPLFPKWVQRPHLIERLKEGLESGRQVTLTSAPTGFGETTCIAAWADDLGLPLLPVKRPSPDEANAERSTPHATQD